MLDERTFAAAVAELCAADRDLAAIVERHGLPPFWAREPGLGTLLYLAFFFLMPVWSRLGTFKQVPDRVTFHAH